MEDKPIKVMVNDEFVMNIDGPRDWTWVKGRWQIVEHHKVQEKIKQVKGEVVSINFHAYKRYLNIKVVKEQKNGRKNKIS